MRMVSIVEVANQLWALKSNNPNFSISNQTWQFVCQMFIWTSFIVPLRFLWSYSKYVKLAIRNEYSNFHSKMKYAINMGYMLFGG
jgi:hypothetical protein